MNAEMVPVIVPGMGDFTDVRAIFNPTVRIDPRTGIVHMFARGVKAGEKISRIVHVAGLLEGPFSLVGEPEIVIETENEDRELTKQSLEYSYEDPRFLQDDSITVVGLERPAYSPKGQRAKTYVGAVQDLHRITISKLLTPSGMPGVDDRHVFPIANADGVITIFSRPQRELPEGDYVDYFTGGPSSVYVSRTRDMTQRPDHRVLLAPRESWEARRIGGLGPMPIATGYGLLGFYMGIDLPGVYRVGAVLMDPATLEVIGRTPNPVLQPTAGLSKLYSVEKYGFGHSAGVVFASGLLIDAERGTIDLFCGYNDLDVVRAQLGMKEILDRLDEPRGAE